MIQVNVRDPRPIYEQVRDGFRRLILRGVLPAGSKMPSVRELAAELAINPNTIHRAYRELELEGCICTVPGRGSFVSASDAAAALRRRELTDELRAAVKELRALGVNEAEILSAIREGTGDD